MGLDLAEDTVDPLADGSVGAWDSFGGCSECFEVANAKYSAAYQKLWNQLPTIFELDTWEELLA
ncbi:hypothetical protein C8R44DRAFT_823221 [Mycena epipterygia]|nr:hypothetical protein C8R44DRAFT_823221 [Mycena epipterygia]